MIEDKDDLKARKILDDFEDFPEFQNWKSFANNITIYAEERKGGILGGRTAGQIDNSRIFDTTIREKLEVFSAGIVSDLTPQSEPWLELESQAFNADEESKNFYNAASDRMRMRIGQSNFYRGFHESVHSGGLLGTFCLAMMPSRKKKFNFVEIPFGQYRFREDEDGIANTVYHEWEPKTVSQIEGFFAKQIAEGKVKLPEAMLECKNSDVPAQRNKKFTIIHVVKPREGASESIPAIEAKRPFSSEYICKETISTILADGGLYYQPYIVTRILKSRHDGGFGRSPGTQIYPTTRVLNRVIRDVGVAIEKGVDPPMLVPKDSSHRRDTRPHGEIIFDPHIANGRPEPYIVPFDIQAVEWFTNRLEDQISNAFFNDMFKFFTNQRVATTEKTAFEAQLQAEEQLRLFTPIFLNIVDECLDRVAENMFIQMYLDGDFADLIEDAGGEVPGNFSVTYNSRIALAVKAQRSQGAMRVAQASQMIDQFVPGAGARALDWEGVLADMAQDSTVSAARINKEEKRSQLKERDDQIMALNQQLEQLQMGAQAISQLSPSGTG